MRQYLLQKTTTIESQAESIFPDIPPNPNEKISMHIFGPLPQTKRGNKCILSFKDRLTRYTVLIAIQNETASSIIEAIIEALIEHYIYVYRAPKTILTDQGANFLAELMI